MYRLPIKLSDSSVFQICRCTRQFNRSLSATPGVPPQSNANPNPQRKYGDSGSSQNKGSSNQKGSGRILLIGAVGITGFIGGTIVWAKNDDGVREWLRKNQPWAESVITVFDMEKYFDSKWIKPFVGMPSKLTHTSTDTPKTELRLKKDGEIALQEIKSDPIEARADLTIPAIISSAKVTPIKHKEVEEKETVASTMADKESAIYKSLTSDETHKAVTVAIQAFENAGKSVKRHSNQLEEVMESAVHSLDREIWEKLKELANKKNAKYQQAVDLAAKAKAQIAVIVKNLQSGIYNQEQMRIWKLRVDEWKSDLKQAETQFQAIKNTNSVTGKYWSQVEKARQNFAYELQCLFPNVDIHAKKLNIPEGSDPATELDLMLLHILKVVTHLQKELAASTTTRKSHLDSAVESANDSELITAKVAEEVEKERRDITLDYQKKILAYRIELENELRRQLKLQVEAHREHLNDALLEKENQVRSSVEKLLSEKLEVESANYKLQLAAMVGKLKGVDDALRARSETDKLARQSVALWSAGESILAALRKGPSSPPTEVAITSIQNEINAIQSAAVGSDELVKAVISGIPNEVKQFGVYSESALRERFNKVETLCRRVALVPEEGASLPVYALSWLQSLLLFKSLNAIPQSELEDQPTDFSKFDTYDILQRARYCVERNDIRGAVQYMSLISGAARHVASGWTRAARDHLATRQAAEVVMAHANAAGMLYL